MKLPGLTGQIHKRLKRINCPWNASRMSFSASPSRTGSTTAWVYSRTTLTSWRCGGWMLAKTIRLKVMVSGAINIRLFSVRRVSKMNGWEDGCFFFATGATMGRSCGWTWRELPFIWVLLVVAGWCVIWSASWDSWCIIRWRFTRRLISPIRITGYASKTTSKGMSKRMIWSTHSHAGSFSMKQPMERVNLRIHVCVP